MTSIKNDIALLILRITIGGNLFLHGLHKVINGIGTGGEEPTGLVAMTMDAGLPAFMAYGVYLGEVVAPLALILGVVTRVASLTIAGTMVMAIYIAHMSDIFTLLERTGAWSIELASIYLLTSVALAMLGAGRFSVDAAADGVIARSNGDSATV